jgi:hypothetical protein
MTFGVVDGITFFPRLLPFLTENQPFTGVSLTAKPDIFPERVSPVTRNNLDYLNGLRVATP